ncbi:hypothetical protein ACWENQ_37415 [Nonomuraea sp. NPDC004354]
MELSTDDLVALAHRWSEQDVARERMERIGAPTWAIPDAPTDSYSSAVELLGTARRAIGAAPEATWEATTRLAMTVGESAQGRSQ